MLAVKMEVLKVLMDKYGKELDGCCKTVIEYNLLLEMLARKEGYRVVEKK